MKTSTSICFVLAIVLVTLGMVALWFHAVGGLLLASLATLSLPKRQPAAVSQPPCERYKRNVAILRLILVAFVLATLLFPLFATPDMTSGVTRVIYHPAFVVAFWLFWMQAIIRQWIELKGQADA